MKQLSGLDATFLYLETPAMPMHVGALHVFELPAGYKGKFVTALRKHIASRLPVAPVLRRKLWWMPLNLANPAWVDAEPDLKQHIVEITLPSLSKGGAGMPELEAQVSRLHPVAAPWLNRPPLGDGHPVVVFPGLGAADMSTAPLRNFLRNRGYTPYPWKQGFNFGPRQGVLDSCRAQVQQVAQRHQEKVSL